jgi:hypothetical protein
MIPGGALFKTLPGIPEAVTLAVVLKDMDSVGQAVQENFSQ